MFFVPPPSFKSPIANGVNYYNFIVGGAFIGRGDGDDVIDGGMLCGDVEMFLVVLGCTGVGSGGGNDTIDGGAFRQQR